MAKSKKKKVDAHDSIQVEIPVRTYPANAMFTKEHLGTGDIGGKDFTLSTTIPDGSLLVQFKGTSIQYVLDSGDFIKALDAHVHGS